MKKIVLITVCLLAQNILVVAQRDYRNRFEFTEGVEKMGLWVGSGGKDRDAYAGISYSVNRRNANLVEMGISLSKWQNEFCKAKSVELYLGYGYAIIKGSRVAVRAKINPLIGYENQSSLIGTKEINVFLTGGKIGLEMEVLLKNDNGIFVTADQRIDYLTNHQEWRARTLATLGLRIKL